MKKALKRLLVLLLGIFLCCICGAIGTFMFFSPSAPSQPSEIIPSQSYGSDFEEQENLTVPKNIDLFVEGRCFKNYVNFDHSLKQDGYWVAIEGDNVRLSGNLVIGICRSETSDWTHEILLYTISPTLSNLSWDNFYYSVTLNPESNVRISTTRQ